MTEPAQGYVPSIVNSKIILVHQNSKPSESHFRTSLPHATKRSEESASKK